MKHEALASVNPHLWGNEIRFRGGRKVSAERRISFLLEGKLEKLKVWIEWRIVNYCLSAANTLALMMLIFITRATNSHFYVGFCSSFPHPLSLSVYILRHTRAPASDPLSFSYPNWVLHICICAISVPLPVSTSFTQPAIRFPRMSLVLLQILSEPTALLL